MKMSLGHTFLKNKVDLLLSFELQKNIVECDFPIGYWILVAFSSTVMRQKPSNCKYILLCMLGMELGTT